MIGADAFETKAETLRDIIGAAAKRFSFGCRQDNEVAVILASDGGPPFNLYRVGVAGPETLWLLGETDEGRHIEVLAHHSAVRVSMIAVPQHDERAHKRAIGFTADHREPEGSGSVAVGE